MENLEGFLHPRRKENLCFTLSPAFVDEKGEPIQWEMRQLSVKEAAKARQEAQHRGGLYALLALIACSLVQPDLKDQALLQGLSQREGRTILSPVDALEVLITDAELGRLMLLFARFNDLDLSAEDWVQKAKN